MAGSRGAARASTDLMAAEQAQLTLTFDLSQPLGIFFDEERLSVEECAEGSQAESLGVPAGAVAVSAGGKVVDTPEQLIEHIQSLKAEGQEFVDIIFNPPVAESAAGARAGVPNGEVLPSGTSTAIETSCAAQTSAGIEVDGQASAGVVSDPVAAADTQAGVPSEEVLPSGANTAMETSAVQASTTAEARLALTFDLGQSLGIFFDEERLLVEECAEGSQAESLGVPAGAVAVSVGGKVVDTPEQLIKHIQALKADGETSVEIVFDPPQQQATAELQTKEQLTLTFDLSQSLGIFFDEERLVVEECAEGSQAESLGVPAGAVAISVGGKVVNTPEQLIEHIQALKADGQQSVAIVFDPPQAGPAGGATMASGADISTAMEVQLTLKFDLSQSLGIFFDEERLVVEECAEGSQAESLGVPAGAVAVAVGGKVVNTPEQLIEHIQALKAAGQKSVDIVFDAPPRASEAEAGDTTAAATAEAATAPPEPPAKPLVEVPGKYVGLEDDGTLMLVGLVRPHPKIKKLLDVTQEQLPKANGILEKVYDLLVICSSRTALSGGIAKSATDMERDLRKIVEILQQAVEAVDSVDLAGDSDSKVARKDLIKFVQVVQDRLELDLGKLAPLLPKKETTPGAAAVANEKDVHQRAAAGPKKEPKPIVVRYQGKGATPPPSDNLYVKGLPGGTTEADVRAIFDGVGDVQSMKVLSEDWGAVAFVRLSNRKQTKIAIDRLNDTVPRRLLERAGLVPSAEQAAALQAMKGAALIARGFPVTVDLTIPLGCEIDDDLQVEEVEEDSQAALLRIPIGAEVKAVAGLPLQSTNDLVAKLQDLKAKGVRETAITLAAPEMVAVFEERPFGLSIDYDHSVGLFLLEDVEGLGLTKGVERGFALTAVNGQPLDGISLSRLFDTLRSVALPAALTFHKVPSVDALSHMDPDAPIRQAEETPRMNGKEEDNDSDDSIGGKSVNGSGQARGRGKGRGKAGGRGRGGRGGEGAGGDNSTGVVAASLDELEASLPPAKRQRKNRWEG